MPDARSFAGKAQRAEAIAIGSAAAFAFPFTVAFVAWPEIPTCGYLVASGFRMYDQISFPHTPLLIFFTAAFGTIFGFTAASLRAIVGLSFAASAVLIIIGARPRRSVWTPLVAGVPLLLACSLWSGGPMLWPDPVLAPVLLAGVLLIEQFERKGDERMLVAGAVTLGCAILVKQTSAAIPLVACAWIALRSTRRSARHTAIAIASALAPYAIFAVAWGVIFRTVAHIRWTLLVPLQMGHAEENRTPLGLSELHESLTIFLPILAYAFAIAALPRTRRLRSPAIAIALATFGMAYPRADQLHLSAGQGVLVLITVRVILMLSGFMRRGLRHSPGRLRLVHAAIAGSLVIVTCGVVTIAGLTAFHDRFGGPAYYWDDAKSRQWEAILRRRVHPGDSVLLLGVPWDTLYPRVHILPPGRVYVNTSFWDCINKEGTDERVVRALVNHPGTLILFADTTDVHVRETKIYRYVTTQTEIVEQLDSWNSWRRVPPLRVSR